MSPCLLPTQDVPVESILSQHADRVEAVGRGVWRFELDGAAHLTGTARLDAQWLRLTASRWPEHLEPCAPEAACARMMRLNGQLPGGVKFFLPNSGVRFDLAAETPVEPEADVDLSAWLGQTLAGFREGARQWSLTQDDDRAPPDCTPTPAGAEGFGAALDGQSEVASWTAGEAKQGAEPCTVGLDPGELAEHVAQAGWPMTQRSSGHVLVTLDVPEAQYQAALVPMPGGRWRLSVALVEQVPPVPVCRWAADVLLLLACRVVRMARAYRQIGPARKGYGWEVVIGPRATAWLTDHALTALSVACQLTAQETIALFDEALACRYLTARGMRLGP